MGRLFKYLIYLTILAAIGLVTYTYLGPWFGVDFSAPQGQITLPVVLDAN
ncbi:MAG: hypothetical protein L3J36_01370 [Rhodobacteraceae bacterium]|nr:hypothetical protein [Paracoccaceae bacterium]